MSEEKKGTAEVPIGVAAAVVKSQFEKRLSIRVALDDLMEMYKEVTALREQVALLQGVQTAQLMASRDACFEAAAMACEERAVDFSPTGYTAAGLCATAIRELANR